MYPLLFEPVYKNYVWGGRRFESDLNRTLGKGPHAESWEICDHPDGMSVVENGPLAGKTLHEILSPELVGTKWDGDRFPLLFKIIDAKENLSLQVHPDEEVAEKLGSEPKTEMWSALDKSTVLCGFSQRTEWDEFSKDPLEYMREVEMKPYQSIFIPAGTPHAIKGGSFVYEVQQNSNTTYRIYDWGRKRKLNKKEAKEALHFVPSMMSLDHNPYFQVKWIKEGKLKVGPESFIVLYVAEGEADINGIKVPKGRTVLLPASMQQVTIKGPCKMLSISLASRPSAA